MANLSRNVIVESADPGGVRGHTVYHRFSRGGISYARFAHLGKEGVLGRYAIHFHLVGDTMRGGSVRGAAIVDSHNRWITVHGTQYLLIRDCVGFQSVGHGFFLEDGSVPYFVHDFFGPGRHARVVSTKAKDLLADGNQYRSLPPLTGDESVAAEVTGVPAKLVSSASGVVDWQATVEAGSGGTIVAFAKDQAGNIEQTPHRLRCEY